MRGARGPAHGEELWGARREAEVERRRPKRDLGYGRCCRRDACEKCVRGRRRDRGQGCTRTDAAAKDGRGRARRKLKDALLASAQIAGEAKAWERGKRVGQRGIMPPGTDVGAVTRARGPEWMRGGEDTCRGMRRARMHAGGPDRWERGKCLGAKVSGGENAWIMKERHGGRASSARR